MVTDKPCAKACLADSAGWIEVFQAHYPGP
jgi:hypothetical protein